MVAILGFMIFAGALGTSVAVIAAMVAPRWQRIVRLASGHLEPEFMPLAALAVAERRIAARRWAIRSFTAPISRWQAAA